MRQAAIVGWTLGAALAAGTVLATPMTLTFDDYSPQSVCQNALTTGGLSFALTSASENACLGVWPDNLDPSTNGTPALIYGFASLDVSPAGGDRFYLGSLLAGLSSGAAEFLGTATLTYDFDLPDGGSLTGSFLVGQGLESYSFDKWVSHATFGGALLPYVVIDDMVVDTAETAPIPEPATWTLLMAGLGLTAWRRRARRS